MVFLFVLAVYFASFTLAAFMLIGLVMGCRYLVRRFGDRRFDGFPERIQNLNRSYSRW